VETYTLLDVAGRVFFVRRGPGGAPLMTAMYTYYANGQVQSVTYKNGASIWYTYDNGNRLQQIDHKDWTFQVLHSLHYTYNKRDLPTLLTESGTAVPTATTTFEYDDRGRLIGETRISAGDDDYDISYEYDQVGNRKRKLDSIQLIDVVYHYDTDIDPEDPIQPYQSRNNRLMSYQTFDAGGLDSTTYYYYNDCGNVTRVVTHEEGTHDYSSTWLQYARNGSTVTYVLGESWLWTGNSESDPTSYTVRYAHEFRYDGARQRYLNREIYAPGLLWVPHVLWPVNETWSDYDRDDIHGDFTADDVLEETFEKYVPRDALPDDWNLHGLTEWTRRYLGLHVPFDDLDLEVAQAEEIFEKLQQAVRSRYEEKEVIIGSETMRELECVAMLRAVDSRWKDHLYAMDLMKEGIGLRGYGGKDPIIEYKHEAFNLFSEMIGDIKLGIAEFVFRVQVAKPEDLEEEEPEPRRAVLTSHDPSVSALANAPAKAGVASGPNAQAGNAPDDPQKTIKLPVRVGPKVGRNDPCPCGSGKKYKKCCGV